MSPEKNGLMDKILRSGLFFLIITTVNGFSYQRFTNYNSSTHISDMIVERDSFWAATSGGLYVHDKRTQEHTLFTDANDFPDLYTTALCKDPSGNLWIGTAEGYLYYWQKNGVHKIFSSYYSSKWGIRDLFWYEDYLIVGSNKGCSIFDPRKGTAIKNAGQISTFAIAEVNKIIIFNDTLFLGCKEGVAKLSVSGGKLVTSNFFDKSIWSITVTDTPVVDFWCFRTKIYPSYRAIAVFNGMLLYGTQGPPSDPTCLLWWKHIEPKDTSSDTSIFATFIENAGNITCLVPDANMCWIGTQEGYFLLWAPDFSIIPIKFENNAIPFSSITKVQVSKGGGLWLWSEFDVFTIKQYQGIALYLQGVWNLFNSFKTGMDVIGYMGSSNPTRGLCETRSGAAWFGSGGGNIKVWKPNEGWSQYFIGNNDTASFRHIPAHAKTSEIFPEFSINGTPPPEGLLPWGKSDAIAQDSSGYIWIAAHNSTKGCLIAYDPEFEPAPEESDPQKAHYKRFFEKTEDLQSLWMEDIITLNVDRKNRIFVGDVEGDLVVFKHSGNPLTDNLSIIYKGTGYSKITDMFTDVKGTTWIATNTGLLKMAGDQETITKLDSLKSNYTAVEIDDSIIYLGTAENGFLRWDQHSQPEAITHENGLISNRITDMSLDKAKGCLWIGTTNGLSRYDLGSQVALTSSTPALVYPNPYSLKRNRNIRSITFKKLNPHTYVSIHSLDGKMITKINSTALSSFEWIAQWIPPSTIFPGPYFYVVHPDGIKGKLLLTP